jgi:hypothetical protein
VQEFRSQEFRSQESEQVSVALDERLVISIL